jgi:Chitin recognition protein
LHRSKRLLNDHIFTPLLPQSFHLLSRERRSLSVINTTMSHQNNQNEEIQGPVLPSGQVIDAKNTLQSFDTVALNVKVAHKKVATKSSSSRASTAGTNNDDYLDVETTNNSSNDTTSTRYQVILPAFAVPVDENIEFPPLNSVKEQKQKRKRSLTFWVIVCCIAVTVCAIVIGVGTYCGSGNCNNSSAVDRANSPTEPEANVPKAAPISVPTPSPIVDGSTTCGRGVIGNGICTDATLCCSRFGFCGGTFDFCDPSNIAPIAAPNARPPTPTPVGADGSPCGNGTVGNGICPDTSLCCSRFGFCGSTTDFCGAGNIAPIATPSNPTPTPVA